MEDNKTKEEINNEPTLEGGDSMVKLWILRLRIGMGRVETVPTVYRVPVYTGAIEDGIITMEDVPANYKERVQSELDKNAQQ